MPGIHAKNTYVELDSVDISTYCDSLSISDGADEIEVTGFTDTSKQYVSGFRDINGTLAGNWGDADGSAVGDQLATLRDSGASVALLYGPAGDTAGYVKLLYDCKVMSFDITSAIGAAVKFSAKLRLSNASVGAFS